MLTCVQIKNEGYVHKRLDKGPTAPRVPVRSNGVATNARVIEAATALLGRDDGALTMRALAQEAGCSPAAIYQFFVDMDDVIANVAQIATMQTLEFLEGTLPNSLAKENPKAYFTSLIRAIITLQAERPETLCIARPPAAGPRAALASALRSAVSGYVRAAFIAGYPEMPRAKLDQVLDVAQNAMLGALTSLPPRDDPQRDSYLVDIAILAGGFVAEALNSKD